MAITAASVGVVALALYVLTLLPGLGFWDTAEFQAIGPVLGIAHPTGYPAYTLLAWLASVVLQPFGNEALRANLLSAILVAGACALVGVTVSFLTRRAILGIGAGLGLAVSTEAWAVGLHADPHALHLLLAALLLLLLSVWYENVRHGRQADLWLVSAAIVFGVSLANHALTLLLAPGIGLFVLAAYPRILRRPFLIVVCAASLALTTVALYAYLPIRSAMNPPLDYANPQTWEGFRYLVFAEQFRGTFQALPDLANALQQIAQETFSQLGLLAVLAVLGVVLGALRRPALVLMLALWFGVNWWFALGYINADIGRYYLVPLMSVVVLAGLGADGLLDATQVFLERHVGRRDLIAPALTVIAAVVLVIPPLAAIPPRYGLVDESGDHLARQWLDAVGAALAPNAVIVSWWSYSTPMWYGQYVEDWRPDVTIIDDRTMLDQHLGDAEQVIDGYLGRRPVYLMRLSQDLPRYDAEYVLERVPGVPGGELYRVDGRRQSVAGAYL